MEPTGCSFFDSNNGWVTEKDGTIRKTTDAGATWTDQFSGTFNYLEDVFFSDLNNGTAVGQDGAIVRTTDGGETWTPQISGTTNVLEGVVFTDANNGTVVGANGTILHTADGGTTWILQNSGSTQSIHGISFGDGNTATVVGDYGSILRTANGNPTAIDDDREWGDDTKTGNLSTSYPNPLSSTAVISFSVTHASHVHLEVFDAMNRRVTVLIDQVLQQGTHERRFDASSCANGVYFYRLHIDGVVETRQLVVLR